ncbi:hypothetical protein ACP4J1_28315, partial [Streptomyces sp. MH13]
MPGRMSPGLSVATWPGISGACVPGPAGSARPGTGFGDGPAEDTGADQATGWTDNCAAGIGPGTGRAVPGPG